MLLSWYVLSKHSLGWFSLLPRTHLSKIASHRNRNAEYHVNALTIFWKEKIKTCLMLPVLFYWHSLSSLSLSLSPFFSLGMMSLCGRAATPATTIRGQRPETMNEKDHPSCPVLFCASGFSLTGMHAFLQEPRSQEHSSFLGTRGRRLLLPCDSYSHSAPKHVFIWWSSQPFPSCLSSYCPSLSPSHEKCGCYVDHVSGNSESLSENRTLDLTVTSATTLSFS